MKSDQILKRIEEFKTFNRSLWPYGMPHYGHLMRKYSKMYMKAKQEEREQELNFFSCLYSYNGFITEC